MNYQRWTHKQLQTEALKAENIYLKLSLEMLKICKKVKDEYKDQEAKDLVPVIAADIYKETYATIEYNRNKYFEISKELKSRGINLDEKK